MKELRGDFFIAFKLTALVIGMIFVMPFLVKNADSVSFAAAVGTSCNAAGHAGICRDRNTTSCSGYYDSGNYCPGGNNIQCCVTGPVACTAPSGSGVCHNSSGANNNACSGGGYTPGHCPGPNDVQCCVVPPAPPPSGCQNNSGCTAPQVCQSGKCVNPPQPTSTIFSLDLLLHGIGKAGDSLSPWKAGDKIMVPNNKDRDVTVVVSKSTGNELPPKTGKLTYDETSGSFKGNVDMGDLAGGIYEIRIKLPQSQQGVLPVFTVNSQTINKIPQMSLVTGDVNNDGIIQATSLDYNILLDCYSDPDFNQPAKACDDPNKKNRADLNDDGNVDSKDFNLFLREITNLSTP